MNLVYLIGPPAVGKSSLMRALTAGCWRSSRAKPIAHDRLIAPYSGECVGIELGRARNAYPGTDALPLNVSPAAKAFLASRPAGLVLGEGDRLAHNGFLEAASEAGYQVTVVYLTADQEELDRRCAERGSRQSVGWRTGRATKAARLARSWPGHALVVMDSAAPPASLAGELRQAVPALEVLPR